MNGGAKANLHRIFRAAPRLSVQTLLFGQSRPVMVDVIGLIQTHIYQCLIALVTLVIYLLSVADRIDLELKDAKTFLCRSAFNSWQGFPARVPT